MSQYIRHTIAPVEAIFPTINEIWPEDDPKMTYHNWTFRISSLRLRTFCRAYYRKQFHCSQCQLPARYFAVESFARGNQTACHINLYGLKEDGSEVLFTHDHTLARSLGGVDNLSNTTMMCFTCNNKKGRKEGAEARRRQRKKDDERGCTLQSSS